MRDSMRFAKMSGAGNDFVVLAGDVWNGISHDRADWVRAVCRRGLSVGADGVLVVSAEGPDRVRVRFFNPDGGEAFCGNGSRCAARYALLRGLTRARSMTLLTSVGEVPAAVDGGTVSLRLSPPRDLGAVSLEVAGASFHGRWIDAGVPHVVLPVVGLVDYPLGRFAPSLRRHPALGPSGANVNLVENDSGGRVHVRTWERGVENETLACGTGAIAAALAARLSGAPESVTVVPRSGSVLTVTIPGEPSRPACAVLAGDARLIFEAELDPEATTGRT
jgi:diaminopimelate epimerase